MTTRDFFQTTCLHVNCKRNNEALSCIDNMIQMNPLLQELGVRIYIRTIRQSNFHSNIHYSNFCQSKLQQLNHIQRIESKAHSTRYLTGYSILSPLSGRHEKQRRQRGYCSKSSNQRIDNSNTFKDSKVNHIALKPKLEHDKEERESRI